MSLVTIQRSPTPTNDSTDSSNSVNESNASQSEDFIAYKDTVVLQNQYGRRRSSIILETDILQVCLKKTVEILRKQDTLKLIVNIDKANIDVPGFRYFCLVSTHGVTDKEEFAIIGIDVTDGNVTVGMVIPIYQDVTVKLDGDGGFQVTSREFTKLFKPISVHSLWTTVQSLNKACNIASQNNCFCGGFNHTWIGYYQGKINSSSSQIAEWNKMINADTKYNSQMAPKSGIGQMVLGSLVNDESTQKEEIRRVLRDIMRDEDMDTITVLTLRTKLQEAVEFNVMKHRSFIAEEIMIICGQLDKASMILPYLYLGSTYNAANHDELAENKITHIINVTQESENFFRDKFKYKNIEVLDRDETVLDKYFDTCHKFINEARDQPEKGVCFVHCQRGISRSATIVISYIMKECRMNFEDAYDFVRDRREIVRPNDGFIAQLKTYQGVLQASANRHNLKFRSEVKSYPSDSYRMLESELEATKISGDTQNKVPFIPLMPPENNDSNSDASTLTLLDMMNQSEGDYTGSADNSNFQQKGTSLHRNHTLPSTSTNSQFTRGINNQDKRSFRLKTDTSWIKKIDSSEENPPSSADTTPTKEASTSNVLSNEISSPCKV